MDSCKSKAQEIIDKHNLEPILAEMLNTLVHKKTRHPEIFMIKYLASYLSSEEKAKYGIHVPDSDIKSTPIVKLPVGIQNEVLKNQLKTDLWNKIKFNKTKQGSTIMDVVFKDGVKIPDADVSNHFYSSHLMFSLLLFKMLF
jgi:hypothetical protein